MARAKRKVATLDSETDPFEYGAAIAPFIWDIFDGVEHYTFRSTAEMLDFLADKDWLLYAHNGGKFDFRFPCFRDRIPDGTEIKMVNGRFGKFKIGDCEFRDSYLILPMPLAGYKKKEFDYDKLKKNVREKHMTEIVEYLHSDTEYLYELVTAFISEYGNGLTLAGSAFKVFNKEFSEIENEKTNPAFYDMFSDFYYGGRVECFKKGVIKYPTKMIDINSAYPRAMMQRHAFGKSFVTSRKLPEDRNELEKGFVHFIGKSKGALPYRNKEEKSLEFPNDNKSREFFVSGWELVAAQDLNCVTVERVISFHSFSTYICFDKYVTHFYGMKSRSEQDSTDYIFAKLFLNSLYGKYAADPDKYTRAFIHSNLEEGAEEGLELTGKVGARYLMERELFDDEKNYYNVATAASITGWVRAYLFRALKSVNTPIYCDTDSIICRGTGRLPLGDKLGEWKLDGEFIRGGIGGKKIYAFELKKPKIKKGKKITHKTACKGAKLSASEIMRVCQGETIIYKNPVPNFSFKTSNIYVERTIRMT